MSKINNSKFHIRLPLLLALAISAGMLIGATMATNSTSNNLITSVLKFREVLTYIEKDYVDQVDSEELVESAINTMLEKLDPHSVYIPAKDLKMANSQLEGEFDGIGIEFSIIKDTIHVISPLSGGPSEKVGLLSGDKIIKVDDKNVAGVGITNREVFEKLRGPKGTEVNLGIKRNGSDNLNNFKIIRDKIPQHSLDVSYMINKEVGYIKVSRFSATTYEEFKQALSSLKSKGMNKLILDLQGNPGGYLGAAFNMADELISGNKMIVYTDGKDSQYDTEYRARKKGMFEEGPVIILIDEGSASASEIVAGAIQDNDRGLIVGRRSFGKGLVQMPIDLSDGSELRLTISRYYTPSGRSIQKPYKSGSDPEYKTDILNRYEHGELFNADSIKFNDSLKYETSKGRIVYGGGGIMPDFFVAIDTTMNTKYFTNLFSNNVIREHTLHYYELNKKKLEKMQLDDFVENFEVTPAMLNDIVNLASRSNVTYNQKEFESSKDLIKTTVKAHIAKAMWHNEGYYKVFNETNEVLQQGLNLFDEAEELAMN
ncbi:S41 family peptidase [soil metagenome]